MAKITISSLYLFFLGTPALSLTIPRFIGILF